MYIKIANMRINLKEIIRQPFKKRIISKNKLKMKIIMLIKVQYIISLLMLMLIMLKFKNFQRTNKK